MAGTGWVCRLGTTSGSRSDVLARGASYPDITVTVSVSAAAASSLTNHASVDGGGCVSSECGSGSELTRIVQNAVLSIVKSHAGSFRQGDTGDLYTLTV